MDNMSISDIASVIGNKDGFLEGNGIIILILFFLIFGFGGGNWGGNQGTQAEIQRGFDAQAVIGKLDGINNGICSSAYENAQLINQANINQMQNANQTQMAMMNGFNGVNSSLCQGFGGVQESINNLSHQMEQCCCNLKTQMMQDKYDALKSQYDQSLQAISNSVQTQNILNSLGRYYTNPPYYPQYGDYYGPGATVA